MGKLCCMFTKSIPMVSFNDKQRSFVSLQGRIPCSLDMHFHLFHALKWDIEQNHAPGGVLYIQTPCPVTNYRCPIGFNPFKYNPYPVDKTFHV